MNKIFLFLFWLCSVAAIAQTNPQYNTVRVIGSDSTTITTNGTIRYNPVSNKFRFRQNGAWVSLGASSGGGGGTWGSITGTLSSQTDLQTALNGKQSTITFGTGVQTALGVNVGSAGAPVLFNGAGGTPSSITLTNGTGLPLSATINTPSGTIAATNGQAAINEVNNEKANILYTFRRLTSDHTLDATDLAFVNTGQRVMLEMNSGSANNLTIPLNVVQAFTIGSVIDVSQYGGGVTTIVPTGGVTLRSSAGVLTLGGQYTNAFLIKVDTDEWYVRNGNPTVVSGTYTPTLTNTANLSASTASLMTYMRVGNTVTVSGLVTIDPTTTATLTTLGISLPVASAFTTAVQAGGTGAASAVADAAAAILSDATNDRATLQYICTDVTNHAMYVTFTYQVL